ncbi:hypothetical protein BDA99DRAFT_532979 [Phascolomyces articulosus]|uniref:Uncharacterized protein n=1 Tax=Phascolomyces articulosus TaxID=60185 RepID=A0AAD5PHT8_9FUNG|nr:hypothetical protein BDA99DRAFT_532979 [Phascolomyces articulosus]
MEWILKKIDDGNCFLPDDGANGYVADILAEHIVKGEFNHKWITNFPLPESLQYIFTSCELILDDAVESSSDLLCNSVLCTSGKSLIVCRKTHRNWIISTFSGLDWIDALITCIWTSDAIRKAISILDLPNGIMCRYRISEEFEVSKETN